MIETVVMFCRDCDKETEFYPYWKTRCVECQKAKQRRFNKANPDSQKAKNHNRRAYELALPDTLKHKEWTSIQARFGGTCAFTESTNVSLEHPIPLCWGRMGNEVGNVIPMDKSLNMSKGKKNLFDWYEENEHRLDSTKVDNVIYYLAEANRLTVDEYIDFLLWCDDNRRTPEEAEAATMSCIEEWKAAEGRR